MPLYTWENKKTGKQVEVLRSFDDYQVPPTKEEAGEEVIPEDWNRLIGGSQRVVKGTNWGPGKGHW